MPHADGVATPRMLYSLGRVETPAEVKSRVARERVELARIRDLTDYSKMYDKYEDRRQKSRENARTSAYKLHKFSRISKYHVNNAADMSRLRKRANELRHLAKSVISKLKSKTLSLKAFLSSNDAHKLRKFRASKFVKAAYGRKKAKEILHQAKLVGWRLPVRHRGSKKRYRYGRLARLIKQRHVVLSLAKSIKSLKRKSLKRKSAKRGTKRVAKRGAKRVAKRTSRRGLKKTLKRKSLKKRKTLKRKSLKKHKTSRRRRV